MNNFNKKCICALFLATNLFIFACFGIGSYNYIELQEIKQELQILEGYVIHD